MIYLNNVQQAYNTQLASNNKAQNSTLGIPALEEAGQNLVNYTLLYAKHNCQGQKTPWNTLVEILRLMKPNHSKIPYQHILLETPRGHGQNYSNEKLASQYFARQEDGSTDTLESNI